MTADVKFNAEIPHIWFDIIARVIPGLFLIMGLGADGCFPSVTDRVQYYLFCTSTVIQLAILSAFIAASFMVGFLIAPLSDLIDRFWNRLCPLDEQTRVAGLHTLWTHPEGERIASLASKRDAEKQASGSLAWTGFVVWLGLFCTHHPYGIVRIHVLLWFVIILSLRVNYHYRKRAWETVRDGLEEIRRNREERK
jgi:hypothetical protein